ncbi:MAG: hypothetical protein ACE5H3_01665 [Planctomycetota bacterium]
MGVLQAQEQDGEPYPSFKDLSKEESAYEFLRLGQDKDYLKAERWRIIDQIESAIPPLYEPVRPFHGYTLPPGAWRVSTRTTLGRNPGDFGRDDFYSLFFNKVTVEFIKVHLNVLYGFEAGGVSDMVVNVDIPYNFTQISGTGHPWRLRPFNMTMDGAGNGLGDISIVLKKKWLDQGNEPVNFATMLGVILPTAQDNQQFNASQALTVGGVPMPAPKLNIFSRRPGGLLLPKSAQPGNGVWGLRVGFGATRQFERSAVHLGAAYDLLAKDDGITPGDELRYGASFVLPPTAGDRFTFDLSVFGFWKGDEKFPGTVTHPVRNPATGGPKVNGAGMPVMVTTARPEFKHGNVTFVSPSLVFIPSPDTRLFISPAFRILEPLQGPSPRWMLTIGATFTF